MDAQDFKKWRKQLALSQKDAANVLGLKRRMIQYYEKGEREGEKVKIPLSVRLACFAISEGVLDYHGPTRKVQRRPDADAASDKRGAAKPKSGKGGGAKHDADPSGLQAQEPPAHDTNAKGSRVQGSEAQVSDIARVPGPEAVTDPSAKPSEDTGA